MTCSWNVKQPRMRRGLGKDAGVEVVVEEEEVDLDRAQGLRFPFGKLLVQEGALQEAAAVPVPVSID